VEDAMNQATSQTSRKPTTPRLIDELVLLLEQQRVDVRAKERALPPVPAWHPHKIGGRS
jgi:hypothetical protein